jgi:hypothetical protein
MSLAKIDNLANGIEKWPENSIIIEAILIL